MVFEFFTGEEVFTIVKKKKKLSEPQAAYCLYDLLQVMIKLKESGIAHRDIKAENLLVNETSFDVKLIDFGLSVFADPKTLQSSSGGSPLYSSPEILAGEKFDPIKADLWSAGILLFYMLCGYLPFYDENISNLYSMIIFGSLEIPSTVNTEAADLIRKLLDTNPKSRPTLEEAMYKQFNPACILGST